MNRIRTGDRVIVIAGKDKGATGTVVKVLINLVLVEGVNIQKKHARPNPRLQQEGGIVEREAPIHISNVALVNPVTEKADRVGFKFIAVEGRAKPKKVRYFKSNGELVDHT